MECKNCNLPLRSDYSFCSNCGAKIIQNRLTLKNLWLDATGRYFNFDNTFIKTFKALFTTPEDVITGYINGTRKKYLNPISYFTIAVTLGGLFIFLNRVFFPEAMDFQEHMINSGSPESTQQFATEFTQKFQQTLLDYQNLFYILMLPVLALISRLVFINKKEFNLSEHFVMNIYAYSQMSICVNILYISVIWNSDLLFYFSSINLLFQILYFSYVFKKIFKLSITQILLKLLLFLLVFTITLLILLVLAVLFIAFFTDIPQQIKATQAML